MGLISTSSLVQSDKKGASASRRSAFLAKGFRPFFLFAGIFAALAVPIWLLALEGRVDPGGYAGALTWHAHEMVFGFTVAVIAGFLLTAVSNWTSRETATGGGLLALAVLWLVGRFAMLAAEWLPPGLVAALDAAFLPALAVVLGAPIWRARSRRNYPLMGLVAVLAAGNVLFHVGVLRGAIELSMRSVLVMVDVIVLIITIITGRVVPLFTRNATRVESIRSWPAVDRVALGSLFLVACADALVAPNAVLSPLLGVAGISSALRAWHWGARHSTKEPLLWVLHVGYAWIPIGLLLRATAAFVPTVSVLPAWHALTVGAIGILTIGMMARVSLGHTGRLLRAPAAAAVAFGLLTLSALVRVGVPLLFPAAWLSAMMISGLLWSAAFALFVVVYAPILVQPRVDGKPG